MNTDLVNQKQKGKIVITVILATIIISIINPISIAVCLVIISITLTPYLYKNITRRWVPLILILTFSSGIMTLFIYAASLTANEKTKKTRKAYPLAIAIAFSPPLISQRKAKTGIKSFSTYTTMILLATILIVTLVALTSQAHNPNQTLTSSF
jgi:hypothetical protein